VVRPGRGVEPGVVIVESLIDGRVGRMGCDDVHHEGGRVRSSNEAEEAIQWEST
jgi:hypothetical protein